jgi:hypothetical protein
MEDPIKQTKCHKNSKGNIDTKSRNIMGKVGWYSKKYKYISDPYDRQTQFRRVFFNSTLILQERKATT